MPVRTTPEQRARFLSELRAGCSIVEAGRRAGVSEGTARKWKKEIVDGEVDRHHQKHWSQVAGKDPLTRFQEEDLPAPVEYEFLSDEAKQAYDDFPYFCQRYLGRHPTPWRTEAAERTLELYESDDREFLVANAPPGSGKTTLFTHDIPLWLTVRNRDIRGVLGSWGLRSARNFSTNLRRTLARVNPVPVSQKDIDRGWAFEPEGTIAADFGRFKPLNDDVWSADAFIVEQMDGTSVAEKEPTWSAFGQGNILSWRVNFLIFDDLVTKRSLTSQSEQEKLWEWWTAEVEERLEPGGLLILQGQRLGPVDLYRRCLDEVGLDAYDLEEMGIDLDDPEVADMDLPKKYHHIKFKAHYDDICEGDHSVHAKPYPEGCMLVPHRINWRKIATKKRSNPMDYATVYQQEDLDPREVLVPMDWINGGMVDGEQFVGCWDADRDVWETPAGVTGPWTTVITVDPSPTKNWACIAWARHDATDQHFVLDVWKGRMEAPDLLYYLHTGDSQISTTDFSGKLEEWRVNFRDAGLKLKHVVVEKNVAQRFLLQYPHAHDWQRHFQITIHGHETSHRNKADPEYGIQMIRPNFEYGKVRLPGNRNGTGRFRSMKMIEELTRYTLDGSYSGTDDAVMATWLYLHKQRTLKQVDPERFNTLSDHMPDWVRG